MTKLKYSFIENRGILKVSGDDSVEFLQGLVSNNVRNISDNRAIYAALLTPQGKFLFDFFMYGWLNSIMIEMEAEQIETLTRKLNMYKLRANVILEDVSEAWSVAVVWGQKSLASLELPETPGAVKFFQGAIVAVDPRLAAAGARVLLPRNTNPELPGHNAPPADYDIHRLELALPDGSRDMVQEKTVLLEGGFDELHGIDWEKGCYMGQELTARTKYRGLIKKRLVSITTNGATPRAGAPIINDGKQVGEVRSGRAGRALALMRIECLDNLDATFTADGTTIFPKKPDWAVF